MTRTNGARTAWLAIAAAVALTGCSAAQTSEAHGSTTSKDSVPWGDGSISAPAAGSTITITTSAQYAGAISHLTWNGRDFINDRDHGRQLQSAVTYDGLGECMNPTEAGSGADSAGPTSTSQLLSWSANGNVLESQTQMAYWDAPGQPSSCLFRPDVNTAQNTSTLSNDLLWKRVTIGSNGLDNVIRYDTNFHVTQDHFAGRSIFESFTGYMPLDFSYQASVDPVTGVIGPANGALPVMTATPDQQYAMIAFVPNITAANGYYGYGGQCPAPTLDCYYWDLAYIRDGVPAGDYSWTQYLIVGTVGEVVSRLVELNGLLQNPVTGWVDGIANDPDGSAAVNGWACATGLDSSIRVDMYLNGPAGQGSFLTSTTASNPSEPAVAQQCGAGGSSYRFSFPLGADVIAANPGASIWVHGIAPNTGRNPVLGNSGNAHFPAPAPPPPPPVTHVPIYRFYRGNPSDHFLTNSFDEGVNAGYAYEGEAFAVAQENVPGTTPIFRCFMGATANHFLSLDAGCEGNSVEYALGYVFTGQADGTTGLYRGVISGSNDRLSTTSWAEVTGITFEGGQGFVFPN